MTDTIISDKVVITDKYLSVKQKWNKESRNKQGKPRGLHVSNMAVMLTDISDGTCEELGNPVKQLKKAWTAGQESTVWEVVHENHRLSQSALYSYIRSC